MGERVRFDPELVREIMRQGMTDEEYRNAQEPIEEDFDEPIEEVFDEAGRSCVRLLWAALASKFGKQRRRWLRRLNKQPRQT